MRNLNRKKKYHDILNGFSSDETSRPTDRILYAAAVYDSKLTKCRKNGRAPHKFTEHARDENESSHLGAEFVLERVQHGDVLALAKLLGEEHATEQQTESVAKGSLTPNQTLGEDLLGSSVDVPAADPRG